MKNKNAAFKLLLLLPFVVFQATTQEKKSTELENMKRFSKETPEFLRECLNIPSPEEFQRLIDEDKAVVPSEMHYLAFQVKVIHMNHTQDFDETMCEKKDYTQLKVFNGVIKSKNL